MPSSPQSPTWLPPMSRKATWEEQIRRTTAISSLADERYDLFPVHEVQRLTDDFLRGQATSLVRRVIEPFSDDCELALINEINQFYNEINGREAAILACLHVLSPEIALGQLADLQRRREVSNEFLLRQVRAYLQCLLLAHKIRPDVCSKDDFTVAKQLFDLIKQGHASESLPPITFILRAVQEGRCEDLLPESFIRTVLQHVGYKRNLQRHLKELLNSRGWFEASQLVSGLRELSSSERNRRPNTESLLHDVYPDIPMWASWSPNPSRIKLWESSILDPFRKTLAPILDFEGPDTTGNQLQTFRQSSPGMFGPAIYQLPASNGRPILEHLLWVFDCCVKKGVEAIRIFITLCVEPRKISWQSLGRAEAALELRNVADIGILDNFLRSLREADLFAQMQGISMALPIIKSTSRLTTTFGTAYDIAHRGPKAMCEAQVSLCKQLRNSQGSERFAKHVVRLGRALLEAEWLHEHWHDKFINMLRRLPAEDSLTTAFRMMDAAPEDMLPHYREAIAARVAASTRAGTSPAEMAAIASKLFVTDPAWSIPLDYHRESLRYAFLRATMHGFDSLHAVACIRQSEREHDTFVRDLRDLVIAAADTDIGCVKLAGVLARTKSNSGGGGTSRPVAECWRHLLMYLMRRRPPGMLERCEEALLATSWVNWTRALQQLYGEGHYDPEGKLGFTPAKFNAVTARKIAISRTASTNTTSTGSTGRFSMGGG